ncbi:MAG: hypothetical protein WC789_10670 [Lentisphaeria bacterium]
MAIQVPQRIVPASFHKPDEPSWGTLFKQASAEALGKTAIGLPANLIGQGIDYAIGEARNRKKAKRDLDQKIAEALLGGPGAGKGDGPGTGITGHNILVDEVNAKAALGERKGTLGAPGTDSAAPAPAIGPTIAPKAAEEAVKVSPPASLPGGANRIGLPVAGQPTVRVRRAEPPAAADAVFGEGVLDRAIGKLPTMPGAGAASKPAASPAPGPTLPEAPPGMTMTRLRLATREPALGAMIGKEQEYIDKTRSTLPALTEATKASARGAQGAANSVEDYRIGADRSERDLAALVKEHGPFKPISLREALNPDLSFAQTVETLGRLMDEAEAQPGWTKAKALALASRKAREAAEPWARMAKELSVAANQTDETVMRAQRNAIEARDRLWNMAATFEREMEGKRGGGTGGIKDDTIIRLNEANEAALVQNQRDIDTAKVAAFNKAKEELGKDATGADVKVRAERILADDSTYKALELARVGMLDQRSDLNSTFQKKRGINLSYVPDKGRDARDRDVAKAEAKTKADTEKQRQARIKQIDTEIKWRTNAQMTRESRPGGVSVKVKAYNYDQLQREIDALKGEQAALRKGDGK